MIWILTLLIMALLGYVVWAGKQIEKAEAEYDNDPEAYEARYPEHRDFF